MDQASDPLEGRARRMRCHSASKTGISSPESVPGSPPPVAARDRRAAQTGTAPPDLAFDAGLAAIIRGLRPAADPRIPADRLA